MPKRELTIEEKTELILSIAKKMLGLNDYQLGYHEGKLDQMLDGKEAV